MRVLVHATGLCAGAAMVVLLLSVLAQIVGRLMGFVVPSADDVARFAMGISAFFGFAYTYWTSSHIRVAILLKLLGHGGRLLLNAICLVLSASMITYLAYHWTDMTIESWLYADKSPGLVPIPLWIPQTIIAIAIGVFLYAVLYDTARVVFNREPIGNLDDASGPGQ